MYKSGGKYTRLDYILCGEVYGKSNKGVQVRVGIPSGIASESAVDHYVWRRHCDV